METPGNGKRRLIIGSALFVALGFGVAWASSGDWNAAKQKAEEVKKQDEEVKKLLPVETKKIVAAICEADDDSRKSAADSAASNARSHLNDKVSELERTKRDALDQLDRVVNDDKLKDKQSDARSLESEVKSRWDKTNDLTHALRNGNPPVVEYMLKGGQSARHDRADRCDVKDFSLDSGHVDCLMARGDTCMVVEETSDNSHAISKGRDRAGRARSQLESELKKSSSDVLKSLISRKSDFAKCKKFETRVDCFKQCPDIGDDGRYRDASPSWREGC
jgi:hypothetical protein